VAQAATMITYTGEAMDKKMIFTNQFLTVIESLSVFGDEIILEPMDGSAIVKCGTAVATAPFAADAATITSPDFKSVPTLILQLKKEDFQNAVRQGAYVQEETSFAACSKTCYIQPCLKENGERTVKFSSFSGMLYGECECPALIDPKAVELFEQWTTKGIIVKSPALASVAGSVTGDNVLLYLTDAQLVIVNTPEVYNFVTVEGKFVNLAPVLSTRAGKDFAMKLDKNKLKSAFKVIGLYTEAGDASVAADVFIEELEGGKVKVSVKDINNKNQVEFEAEGFGHKELRLNKTQVSRALDSTAGDIVTIHGSGENAYIFIEGSNERAFSFNTTTAKK